MSFPSGQGSAPKERKHFEKQITGNYILKRARNFGALWG